MPAALDHRDSVPARKGVAQDGCIRYATNGRPRPRRRITKLGYPIPECESESRRNLTDDQRAMIADGARERRSKLRIQEHQVAAGKAGGRGRPKENSEVKIASQHASCSIIVPPWQPLCDRVTGCRRNLRC